VHFLDAWTELSIFDLVRLLVPPALLALATVLPGRRPAQVAAIGVALWLPVLRELAVAWPFLLGWIVLWVAIAWQAGTSVAESGKPAPPRPGGIESGFAALLLGVVVLALLIAAIARQDLSPEDGRRASYGMLLLGLGLLHLMLRRHIRRAIVGFAALGLGFQVLDGAARGAQVSLAALAQGPPLLATTIAVALAIRLARGRERYAASAWVSDAHDLHD
jgi:hypothetical protein